MMEARLYFSTKHKLHGLITEAPALPNVICISLFNHGKGGESDISIFRCRMSIHKFLKTISDKDDGITDVEEGATHWTILAR